jgi:hypothetical protein
MCSKIQGHKKNTFGKNKNGGVDAGGTNSSIKVFKDFD